MDLITLALAKKNISRLVDKKEIEILPKTTLTPSDYDENTVEIEVPTCVLQVGKTYTVYLDNGIYKSECKRFKHESGAEIVYIGNLLHLGVSAIDTGESYIAGVFSGDGGYVLSAIDTESTSIAIIEVIETVKPEHLHILGKHDRVVLPSTPLVISDEIEGATQYFAEGKAFELSEGKTYWVHLDNGIFECKARVMDSANPDTLILGNEAIVDELNKDTGECFIVGVVDTTGDGQFMTIVMDTNAGSSVSITTVDDIIKPEYLPGVVLPVVELTTVADATVGQVYLTDAESALLNDAVSKSPIFILRGKLSLGDGEDSLLISGIVFNIRDSEFIIQSIVEGTVLGIGVVNFDSSWALIPIVESLNQTTTE